MDKENFRTSMFIMIFLSVPLVIVIVAAVIIRLKNMGRLKRLNLAGLGNGTLDTKHKELGKWIKKTSKAKKRNGFMRLNQDSDDEEAKSLNGKQNGVNGVGSNGVPNHVNTDSESDEEDVITLPTLSKA